MLGLCVALGCAACRKAGTGPPDRADEPAAAPGAAPAPARPARPAGWQEFEHPERVYHIFVPAQPSRARGSAALNLGRPLQPLEARESQYEVGATAQQPLICTMQLVAFHPGDRATFGAYATRPNPVPPNWAIVSDRTVAWGGLSAVELVVEKSFPGRTPSRAYSVTRSALGPDRAYLFVLERTDRLPGEGERAAFFDSFEPGR